MSNIEKDIKIIKYRVNKCREEFENFGEITFVYNDLDRIEHILAERKQDKETIKKLKLIIEIKDKLNRLDLHKENTTLVLEKVLKTLSRKDIRDD